MKENHYNCIYMYVNKINGRRYVGQAKNFNKRHRDHISASYNKKQKYQYGSHFHCAIRKYGEENFDIIILKEDLQTQCLLNFWECYYIEKYDCLSKENYNISNGGSNGNPFASKTEKEMEEFKQKQSETRIKKGLSKGQNNPMYGKCGADHPNSIKIAQYDKETNELIKVWNGSYEIQRKLGIANNHIISCCKFWEIDCDKEEWFKTHKRYPIKSAGGYIWKYVKEDK